MLSVRVNSYLSNYQSAVSSNQRYKVPIHRQQSVLNSKKTRAGEFKPIKIKKGAEVRQYTIQEFLKDEEMRGMVETLIFSIISQRNAYDLIYPDEMYGVLCDKLLGRQRHSKGDEVISNIRSYISMIITNHILDLLRQKKKIEHHTGGYILSLDHKHPVKEDISWVDDTADPKNQNTLKGITHSVASRWAREDLWAKLQNDLPSEWNTFYRYLYLREVQDLTYTQIATETNTVEGTVKSKINRARKRLVYVLMRYQDYRPIFEQMKAALQDELEAKHVQPLLREIENSNYLLSLLEQSLNNRDYKHMMIPLHRVEAIGEPIALVARSIGIAEEILNLRLEKAKVMIWELIEYYPEIFEDNIQALVKTYKLPNTPSKQNAVGKFTKQKYFEDFIEIAKKEGLIEYAEYFRLFNPLYLMEVEGANIDDIAEQIGCKGNKLAAINLIKEAREKLIELIRAHPKHFDESKVKSLFGEDIFNDK